MSTYCQFIVPNAARFLRNYDHFVTLAKFYVIPKIHRTPMVGRPIAASRSYITRPISSFVDELVKPKIRMPTVLRDSSELIRLLENTVLPKSNCFLVTVVSLYPNVDIKNYKHWQPSIYSFERGRHPKLHYRRIPKVTAPLLSDFAGKRGRYFRARGDHLGVALVFCDP